MDDEITVVVEDEDGSDDRSLLLPNQRIPDPILSETEGIMYRVIL